MYKLKHEDFGFKMKFSGFITVDEMQSWLEESKKLLAAAKPPFGVFVDMQEMKPLADDAQKVMQQGQKLYKDKGLQRSVVILAKTILAMQFKRIAQETGIYQWERYIDASKVPNWEEVGMKWVTEGVDPDK